MRTAGFCPPLMLTRPTPGSCEIFGERRVSARSSTLESGKRAGGERQRKNRRVGRIGFAVERRGRKIGRKIRSRSVDGLLDFLFGHVDVQAEIELQRDDRQPFGADGSHLLQPWNLAELTFQRRRNGRSHDVRIRARIGGGHLDGRVIHFRQRGNRQLAVGDSSRQQNADHQQRGGHRPQDKGSRRAHWDGFPAGG